MYLDVPAEPLARRYLERSHKPHLLSLTYACALSVPVRYGQLAVLPDLASVGDAIPKLLQSYTPEDASMPINVLHLALREPIATGAGAEDATVAAAQAAVQAAAPKLKAKGIRYVSVMVPNPPKWPRIFAFTLQKEFAEDLQRRDMYPTMYNMLELDLLQNWAPVRRGGLGEGSERAMADTGEHAVCSRSSASPRLRRPVCGLGLGLLNLKRLGPQRAVVIKGEQGLKSCFAWLRRPPRLATAPPPPLTYPYLPFAFTFALTSTPPPSSDSPACHFAQLGGAAWAAGLQASRDPAPLCPRRHSLRGHGLS